ncbi:hypothetical protein AFV6_gp53 [Betalipothrixvirus pozzuoliense]|uniref:Uncharacterized protein n=1 Tax=Betalipothrixvirus pozzuoliense TaxID=346882 RepID=A7WKK7_9VIRU|nr:hypothetical protein AFV6_gp53 [Acidianus filamentous virus 6]CAJ31607.1 conserved hypothetical protein [Acidianus filamentous virus 6]
MKVVTFGGNFCYFPLMNYDIVFVDDDYNQCLERIDHPNIIHVSSGVSDDSWESRRYRIAFILREIFSRVNDDLFLVDSDVYIPPVELPRNIYSFCIPARAKPSDDVILFCMSTNLFIPSSFLKFARDVMDDYLKNELYRTHFVDIYLSSRLIPIMKVIPGTYHFVNGKKYVIDDKYIIQPA